MDIVLSRLFRDMRNGRPDDAFDNDNRVIDRDQDGVPILAGAQYVWDIFSLVRAVDKQRTPYLNVQRMYEAAGVDIDDVRAVTGRDSKQMKALHA